MGDRGEGEIMNTILDTIDLDEITIPVVKEFLEDEKEREAWRSEKRRKKAQFTAMQQLPYEIKVKRAEQRAVEFMIEMEKRGHNCHISVGGLDSITLYLFLSKIGIDVPGISVSSIEDKSIQRIHKMLGLEPVKPLKSKVQVLNEDGFPVLSKKIAGRINTLQNPTEKNKTVRHAIITGECGKQGHYAKNSRMQLPKKWLKLFAGMANEEYGTDYLEAGFPVSNKCCYWVKEKPCDNWAKEHNSYPYLGLMASEGGQREEALIENGCNYYGKTVIRSAPFAPFLRQDLLQLALDLNIPELGLLPEIYGKIARDENGLLFTTDAQRTGCSMCGFGVHLEKRPHRFDRLRERNYKEWEFYMYRCCKDKATGQKYGWGRVLDYIGVKWEDEYMEVYNEKTIISEFRSGKSIDKIANDMYLARKGNGAKTSKYDCRKEAEIIVLKYRMSAG